MYMQIIKITILGLCVLEGLEEKIIVNTENVIIVITIDIKAGGFWARGVTAFFDVRVTHVNSKCYQSKPTSEVFKEQEEEKKCKYQQRVLDVEMGSFTSLVFGTNGGMGNECQRFLKHLADKIAQKDTEPYHVVITWLRTQISFELLRSVHACVRGSRTPFRSKLRAIIRL